VAEQDGIDIETLLVFGSMGMLLMGAALLFFVVLYQRKIGRQREQRREAVLQAALSAQEAERRRISMELHEKIQLDLNTVQTTLNRIAAEEESTSGIKEKLLEAARQTADSVHDIRTLSHSMFPPVLRREGLEVALQDFCRDFMEKSGLEVNFTAQGTYQRPGLETETALYRVVQELFNNTLKHAGAGHISVVMQNRNDRLLLMVSDNGCGFNMGPESQVMEGMGMLNIKSRLDGVGVKYAFESRKDEGVSFRAVVESKE